MFEISRRNRCAIVKDVWLVFWNSFYWINFLIGSSVVSVLAEAVPAADLVAA
jgi:hypothetical protein